jgi:hypothetical protein
MSMGVDSELLSKCELDQGLLLATPEEGEDATQDRDRERRCRPHARPILLESPMRRQAESDLASGLPSEDERDRDAEKRERYQQGRILRTDRDFSFAEGLDSASLTIAPVAPVEILQPPVASQSGPSRTDVVAAAVLVGVIADDVTGVGSLDDILIPFIMYGFATQEDQFPEKAPAREADRDNPREVPRAGAPLSEDDAVEITREGGDVIAKDQDTARRIAEEAGNGPPDWDSGHDLKEGQVGKPHYHPVLDGERIGSHVFY